MVPVGEGGRSVEVQEVVDERETESPGPDGPLPVSFLPFPHDRVVDRWTIPKRPV